MLHGHSMAHDRPSTEGFRARPLRHMRTRCRHGFPAMLGRPAAPRRPRQSTRKRLPIRFAGRLISLCAMPFAGPRRCRKGRTNNAGRTPSYLPPRLSVVPSAVSGSRFGRDRRRGRQQDWPTRGQTSCRARLQLDLGDESGRGQAPLRRRGNARDGGRDYRRALLRQRGVLGAVQAQATRPALSPPPVREPRSATAPPEAGAGRARLAILVGGKSALMGSRALPSAPLRPVLAALPEGPRSWFSASTYLAS